MKRLFSQKHFRVILFIVLNIAVMLVCAFLLVPQIDSNDDTVLHTYTSNAYGESTRYSGYTGIVLAEIFFRLQSAIPAYNWVVIIEFVLILVSFCVLSSVVVSRCSGWLGIAFGSAITFLFAPQYYNWIHYTKNAMLFTLAGMILVFFALSGERVKAGLAVLGGVLAFFGAQLRMTSFFAGCVFAFVIGVFAVTDFSGATSVKAWFKKYKRYIIAFAAIFVFVFGMDFAKTAVYNRDGDAAAFWEYCETRATLSDYELPSYISHAEQYQALGITPNDLELIESWSFGDLEYFDTETLQAIIDMREQRGFFEVLRLFATDAPGILSGKPLFWVSVVLLAACLVFGKKRERLFALALFGAFVACFIYQYYIGRTTRWVQDGMIACFAAGLMFCLRDGKIRFGKKIWTAAGAGITIAAILFGFVSYRTERSNYKTYFILSQNDVYAELNADAESLYLADIGALPGPTVPTFSSIPDDIYKNIYLLGGWDTGGAHKNSVLERYGVVGSPYRALVEKENVYLVDKHNFESKAKFINEHIDPYARYSMVDTADGGRLYVFAFSANFSQSDCTKTEDISVSGAVAERYEDNYSFIAITADIGGYLNPGSVCYFEIAMPHGIRATYRATIEQDGLIKAIVPAVDFYFSGDYELRVVVSQEAGYLVSAQSVVVEF